jgi:hypothetical protein
MVWPDLIWFGKAPFKWCAVSVSRSLSILCKGSWLGDTRHRSSWTAAIPHSHPQLEAILKRGRYQGRIHHGDLDAESCQITYVIRLASSSVATNNSLVETPSSTYGNVSTSRGILWGYGGLLRVHFNYCLHPLLNMIFVIYFLVLQSSSKVLDIILRRE